MIDWATGFGVLMIGFALGAGWQVYANRQTLLMKARPEHRTAEKIGDGFYYIVPESEYNALKVKELAHGQ